MKKSTNRKRTLLVACSVILLCMTIIFGTTYALFTDTEKVTNHLKAGDLEITLKRVELLKTTLNEEGYLVTPDTPDKTEVNFSQATSENVFGILDDEKVVPGTTYYAKMKIENNSDVAFGYWIEIVCADSTNGEDLAKQLSVTVKTDKDTEGTVYSGLSVGGPDKYVGAVTVDSSDTFEITVKFVDKGFSYVDGVLTSENDAAQNDDVKFDLVVHAVQLTKAP